ncbi:MAG: metal ABC transporter substrate-binding protein [Synergistaceae bacterium]|nr:metal ABC transporter substrate-binding protein [Synergistaceae bacterium]
MRKYITPFIIAAAVFCVWGFSGAFAPTHDVTREAHAAQNNDGKIKIIATIFPQYDFARAAAGDRADVTMLVRPAAEIHSFEPTPRDIISIRNADVFIYIGGESDAWVDEILESVDTSNMKVLRLMDYVNAVDEEVVEGMQPEEEEEEEEAKDEHIWTSPRNAMLLTQAIADGLSEKDPKNADYYQANAKGYIAKLSELDGEFKAEVAGAKRKMIVFGERFPFRYFTDAYGLDYRAAFPGCSTESDASAATMAYLVRTVRDEKIPVVYTIELSNGNIARAIAEQSGAEVLMLHSCHNLTRSDFESGETYYSLMKKNVDVLRKGLY